MDKKQVAENYVDALIDGDTEKIIEHERDIYINELSDKQEKYQAFFRSKLEEFGVSSPMKLTVEKRKEFFSSIKKEWTTESSEEYQKFFKGMLKRFGANSPNELDDAKKKEFFAAIEKGWTKDKD